LLGASHEESCSAWWIQNRISRNQQTTRQTVSQIRLRFFQLAAVQHFHCNSALLVVVPFTQHLRHFLFIRRNPDRPRLLEFDVVWQLRTQFVPQALRIIRQRKLRVGVIHDDDVSHAGSRRSTSHSIAVDHRNSQATGRKSIGTSGSHNPGAHHDNVMGFFGHNGSDTNAHAERIFRIQQQLGLRIHKRRSLDTGIDLPLSHPDCTFKNAADNAFLFPGLAFLDLSIGIETSQLRAGTGPAGGKIVDFAWAEYKVLTIHSGNLRWGE
jgi:hypothetical protein